MNAKARHNKRPQQAERVPKREPMPAIPLHQQTIKEPIRVKQTIQSELQLITPAVASNWLSTVNTKNRHLSQDRVTRLASDMKSGKWVGQNGETIKFDTTGRMADGQHRCAACVESGAAFESLVVHGVPAEAYSTIDIGKSKTTSDFLHPFGVKNSYTVAATAKLLTMWRNGDLGELKNGAKYPTTPEILKTVADHPGIAESASFVAGHSHSLRGLIPPSYATFIHYVASQTHHNALVCAFLERLGTGLNMTPTDPAYQLRRVLLANRSSKRKLGTQIVLAMLIYCWNYTLKEKPLSDLRVYRFTSEPFPTLEG